MKTWIFQGNPKKFNVDAYLLENQFIWWSIRQKHFEIDISVGDEVYIWRSDGENKFSGGIIARCIVVSIPQEYTNDEESLEYWYEDVRGETYLAVNLEVLEVEIAGLNRMEIQEHEILSKLLILRLRQNTNYLLSEDQGSHLRQLWNSKIPSTPQTISNRFNALPPLQPSGRIREFNFYPDELKARVIFEHLFNNKTHRWLDINVLELTDGKTKGRSSANILYYMGMKADYRGIFQGAELGDVIKFLEGKGESYKEAIQLLKLLDDNGLDSSIELDLEAELAEDGHGLEGQVKYYYGKRYERDSRNRKLAIKKHGLNCYVCDFNFEEMYGERGKDFIEVHHVKPLSTLREETEINPDTDLVPLCANCHRMVHRRKDDVLSIEELKVLIKL